MRNLALLLTGVAVVGVAVTSFAAPLRTGDTASASGLCRRAAPMPPLPPEQEIAAMRQGEGDVAVTASRAPAMESVSPVTTVTEEAASAPPGVVAPSPVTPPPVMVAPAPPSVAADAASDSGDMVVTGTPRSARVEKSVPGSAFAPRRPAAQEPPAGLLTAGEHDDLLNPELYARYVDDFLKGEPLPGVPRVDTARVLTVAVRDPAGRPVPFAPVTLTCDDGATLTLATLADGRATFFPDLDRLGRAVTIGVPGGGEPRRANLTGGDGGLTQSITASLPARPVRALDLALVVDCTGSMNDELSFLQSELRAIVAELRARHPDLDLRVALIAYRDEGDEYVTRTVPLSGELAAVQAGLARQSANGGGDTPEAVEAAMARAAALDWRPGAVHSLFLVADAPPHADDVAATWTATESLRARRVQIVPVAASGVERGAEYLMRAMAAATQSRYLFLTDDSGIGNAHAAPAIDCYRVTKLADAMRRVLDGQLSGRRIEATPTEVIRTVGTYDAGRCVLPRGWARRQ